MPYPTSPSGQVIQVDLRDQALPEQSIPVGQTLGYCFTVPVNTTDPTGEWTGIIWAGGIGTAGYALGAQTSVAANGLASISIFDATGTVLAGLDKQPCVVSVNDGSGLTIFFEVPTGIAASGEYDVLLFVDTTASTFLPATQLFRKSWGGRLIVKPTLEGF